MQASSLRRQVKNVVFVYSDAEIMVREATSNDRWGPASSLMSEIAALTFNVVASYEVMNMIWKRLNDHGKNWRHVYKALILLDYLIKNGSEHIAEQFRENIYIIQTLRDFQYTDRDGRDQGVNVREKAKQLLTLVKDEEKLKQERSQALKTRERMATGASGLGSGSMPPPYPGRRNSHPRVGATHGDEFGRSNESPASFHSSSSSPRLVAELEQARPQTSGEEELQLQLALAMSREETEKPPPPPPVDIDEQTQLQIAMSLSKEEAQKPVQRPPVDMDEDTQLQIALSLSKEEHQQEKRSRQGDESLLQKALEESKREMESKGGTAFMDLVDVFAVPSDMTQSTNPWGDVRTQGATRLAKRDPWDSLEDITKSQRVESPWMAPPATSSPAPPWESSQSQAERWDSPKNISNPDTLGAWASSANTDGDLFDEAMDGGQMNINGRGEGSPELFDLSRLEDSLAAPRLRNCRTPEAFLGATAASLVNLETLIPANPAVKTKNPFLSSTSSPSANNPFQSEQPKLTLSQIGSSSSSPVPFAGSLPYSASLPLPASQQPAILSSSFTHPSQSSVDMPGVLPEPLLPLSSASTMGLQSEQHSQNPFL